jgi:acyl transferase domain-containing protein/SAM-dependent methyltransferase/acyl carrier protein
MDAADAEIAELSPLKRAVLALESMKARLMKAETVEPVAVVGIGCRLPGGVEDPAEFQRRLLAGFEAITEVPPERWPLAAWHDADPHAPGKMNMRRAGFLTGGVDGFDAEFFGIAPREAAAMDPQQRVLLETAWSALEHAAIPPDSLAGTACGVYVGLYNNNYTLMGRGSPEPELIDGWSASGGHTSVAAGRLSYVLGLTGPSIAVDTACSSSLTAVHLAVRALQGGECAMALAGGVHLLLSPEALVASTKLGATAPDGRCKAFDASADGFGHGEGCGVVVLKRLSDAEAAGDRVLAVIRGSAVNQDGLSNSLTAPNGPSQEAVVRAALARGGVAPRLVGYVEAHGTGTKLGDPIEVEALVNALGEGRDQPLMIGSVKTNIGHLEAAAGVAGLIKAVLCVNGGVIPPHLNLTQRNPDIDSGAVDLVIPQQPTPWPGVDGRRIAGVSAFGFGGSNAHVVLEAPSPVAESPVFEDGCARTLPLSAKSPAALTALAEAWATALESGALPMADAARTAAAGRAHLSPWRLAATGSSAAALAASLRAAKPVQSRRPPRVAFLFTGQGAQYSGMAKRAYDHVPVFRHALERCAQILNPMLPEPMLDLLFGGGPLDDTALAQPLTVAVELALAAMWRSWGIKPVAVMGHSVGEYAAVAVARALSDAEALTLAAARGRMMSALAGGGGMLAAFTDEATLTPLLAEINSDFPADPLSLAAVNGPANVVAAGGGAGLERLAATLAERGIEGRRLAVSHAFHSARLDPVLPTLERLADAVAWRAPVIPVISNLTGEPVSAFNGAYWRDHARQPVRFAAGLDALAALGCDVFLELGPQPVLSALVAGAGKGETVASLRRGRADDVGLMEGVAKLFALGAAPDWTAVCDGVGSGGGRRVAAPTYPFQRQRHWLDLPTRRAVSGAVPALTAAPTLAEGSQTVYGFYDELTVVSRTYETTAARGADNGGGAFGDAPEGVEAEAHLTFGFFSEPVPGFSWVRALFEKDADPAAHALFRSSQRALKDSLFDGVDFSRIRRVFDYGCGHAADLCALALAHPHLSAQGFTISARQVEVGTQRLRRLGLADRVRVDRNDSSVVPFPGQFDLIFGFEVTGLIADKDGLFDNIVSHLAPGGLLVVADFVSTGDAIANEATNSFTPSYDQWVDLLSRRRLRLVRVVDASPEVANWLDDATFEATVDELTARFGLGELTKRHLLSNENIGKALRHDVMRYLLLTAQVAPHETVEALTAANAALLRGSTPYAQTAPARKAPAWRRWIHAVNWMATPSPVALPEPAALARALALIEARERAALAGFGQSGAVMDGLSRDFTIAAFRTLGATTVEAAARLTVAPPFVRLRDWLVKSLAESGVTRLPEMKAATVARRAEEALTRHPDAAAELALLLRCGPALAEALTGAVDPLALLFPGGDVTLANRLYEESPYSRAAQILAAEATALLPRERPLRVIEIGGGTGATTAHLLGRLPVGSRYLFTDLGASLVAKARDRFAGSVPDGVRMDFARFDVSRAPVGQGVAVGAFDLVVAANVLHATDDLGRALDNVHDLLAPGGLLLLVENTGTLAWGDLTFGLTEGMWAFTDTHLRDYALLRQDQWRATLPSHGFGEAAILTPGEADRGGVSQQCVILAQRRPYRHWALAGGPADVAATLADALRAAGDRVSVVTHGEDCPEDADDWVSLSGTQPNPEVEAVLRPALALVQRALNRTRPPRVTVVSVGGEAGLPGCQAADGTLPGFARAVMGEAAELGCRLIDLDPALPLSKQVEALTSELRHGLDGEAAWRGGRRRLPGLARLPAAEVVSGASPRVVFDAQGGYLVTGGLGGIGLKIAAWMVERGARHLTLAGRRPPKAADAAALQALRDQGAALTILQADVGRRDDVAALLDAGLGRARLKGVIHSAGLVADAALAGQSWAGMDTVLNAKLRGSWHLHELTRDLTLDHFVLFSSAAGLIGPAGQANHAAANSAVDVIAQIRRDGGLPALAVDWGAWAEVGAAVKDGVKDHVGRTGLIHMAPRDALAALEWAMAQDGGPAHLAIVDADWPSYAERFLKGGLPTLLRDLAAAPRTAAVGVGVGVDLPTAGAANARSRTWRDDLAGLPGLRRMDSLRDRIRGEAARVMRMPDAAALDDDRGLRDLGLDSLMSVELRNALMARLEARLPATLLFDHPTVTALADFLAGDALAPLFPVEDARSAAVQDGDDLDGLDAAALSALLAAELGEDRA